MTHLLVEVAAVLAVTVVCGWLARQFGQTRVIGEIIGGILIGPSVLGRLAPHLSAYLFNKASFSTFDSLSTIGLILFLFVIGMEVNCEQLYKERGAAVFISAASIVFPFATAVILAQPLHTRFAPQGVEELPFMLFLGIAMSITAFPVLARILDEWRLQGTPLGTTAIFCAAVNDLVAWILLAFALALIGRGAGPASLPIRLIALVAYLLLMLAVVRPLIKWIMKRQQATALSVEFLGVPGARATVRCRYGCDRRPSLVRRLSGGRLLPPRRWLASRCQGETGDACFGTAAPTVLCTHGNAHTPGFARRQQNMVWAAIVLLAAVLGKAGGTALAARWRGQAWRDALALGALLNTRGLVELIVLNIAYSAGVFTPQLFTMLVIMALLTTMIATPTLRLLGVDGRSEEAHTMHGARTESITTTPAA